jgi:hypothetical protein
MIQTIEKASPILSESMLKLGKQDSLDFKIFRILNAFILPSLNPVNHDSDN